MYSSDSDGSLHIIPGTKNWQSHLALSNRDASSIIRGSSDHPISPSLVISALPDQTPVILLPSDDGTVAISLNSPAAAEVVDTACIQTKASGTSETSPTDATGDPVDGDITDPSGALNGGSSACSLSSGETPRYPMGLTPLLMGIGLTVGGVAMRAAASRQLRRHPAKHG